MDWPASTTDIGVVETRNRYKGQRKTRRIPQYDKSAGLVKERREVKGRRPYILAGPILDYGADGPATLGKTSTVDNTRKGKERERWEWKYATAETDDERYKYRAGESCRWFPPTWKASTDASQSVNIDEDGNTKPAGSAAQVARKKELANAIAGLEGMAGLDSALLETLFDETPVQASFPTDISGDGAAGGDEGEMPIGIGNRLATEIEGPLQDDDTQDLGNPNKLAILTFLGPRAESDPVYFLAFPSGEDRRSLNISPFRKTKNSEGEKDLAFCPTAAPCMVFPSPILQISVSNSQAGRPSNRNTVYLAIRLETFTYIVSVDVVLDLHVFRSSTLKSRLFPLGMSPIQVREVDRIDLSRTKGARHMDVAMHPNKRRECVIIDGTGRLWRWRMVTNRRFAEVSTYGKISKFGRSRVKSDKSFYRLAWHEWERHLIVITAKTVEIFDTALGTSRRVIDFVNSSTRILDLYANPDLDQATYAAILTTETIVWFDPAHDGRIMLSWKHYLSDSGSLRLIVLPAAKRMNVAVLSLKRGILTAFPVEEAGSILRISVQPYDILVRHNLEGDQALDDGALFSLVCGIDPIWHFVSVADTGELAGTRISSRGDNLSHRLPPVEAQWSQAVTRLAPPSEGVDDILPLRDAAPNDIPTKERDLQRFWNSLVYRVQTQRDRPLRIDEMRRLVTDQEELYGMGMLTGLDIAALANDDDQNDVKIGSSYLRGYDLEDSEPPQRLQEELNRFRRSKLARKIQNLPDILPVGPNTLDTLNNSTGYDQSRDRIYSRLGAKRLAIDLQLSKVGISTDDRLSAQGSTNEAPYDPLHPDSNETLPDLAYLRRRPIQSGEGTPGLDTSKITTMRSLLSQWTVGTDPSKYSWPGVTSHVTGTRVVKEPELAKPPPEPLQPVRPPILETSTQPVFESKRRQPLMSSQSLPGEELAATQMLPGPFANRNTVSFRRGGAKKRTIGF